MAGLRDSDVHFAPGVGDSGDEDEVPLDPRMEELLGKKKQVNKDEDDVDFDPDKIRRAADEELEAEDLDIKAPADKTQQKTDDGEDEAEKPVDTSDPTYKAALVRFLFGLTSWSRFARIFSFFISHKQNATAGQVPRSCRAQAAETGPSGREETRHQTG